MKRETAVEEGNGLADAEVAVAEQHRQRLLQRHQVAVSQIDADVTQRLQRYRLMRRPASVCALIRCAAPLSIDTISSSIWLQCTLVIKRSSMRMMSIF